MRLIRTYIIIIVIIIIIIITKTIRKRCVDASQFCHASGFAEVKKSFFKSNWDAIAVGRTGFK